jgi:hypothetical protein
MPWLWANRMHTRKRGQNEASRRPAEAIINRLTRSSALRAAVPVRLDLGAPARAKRGRLSTAMAYRRGGALGISVQIRGAQRVTP